MSKDEEQTASVLTRLGYGAVRLEEGFKALATVVGALGDFGRAILGTESPLDGPNKDESPGVIPLRGRVDHSRANSRSVKDKKRDK